MNKEDTDKLPLSTQMKKTLVIRFQKKYQITKLLQKLIGGCVKCYIAAKMHKAWLVEHIGKIMNLYLPSYST
ncbi:MAG: hypothetical protein KZQ87_18920 [Candidatus Thiodiazotropha sp. (ex Cardiolucina cf. quadrata)]|nr:hypothetical protein [Candidatus Thiodiazotropha sp. (ex Cardiolucina cf. quadrata)]